MGKDNYVRKVIDDLKERAKELQCLYTVQELLHSKELSQEDIFRGIIKAIAPGWQYSEVCQSRVIIRDKEYHSEGFEESKWSLSSDIHIQDEKIGEVSVSYKGERPLADEGPFLKEERKLIDSIAEQIGYYFFHDRLKSVFQKEIQFQKEQKSEWWVVLEMLKRTDPKLLVRISRKMVNYLGWSGIKEGEGLFEHFSPIYKDKEELFKDGNKPYQRIPETDLLGISEEIFEVAGKYLSSKDILDNIHKWIKQDRSGFLSNVLENTGSTLVEIIGAIERFHHLEPQGLELSKPREKNFRVALIRRILSDQPDFINISKEFVGIEDFNKLIQQVIFPVGSFGKLGGKSAGLFVSKKILDKSSDQNPLLKNIKTPKTWYLTSDGLLSFMFHNNLEDILEQKYKDIDQVRKEYPYVIHVFKNSSFAPEIVKGLSLALDDFGEIPLIVRSSSLLEDRLGTAFAGKYKSLFIANKGNKKDRLLELMDAISEVYASTFGPDPIEYRSERDLLDYHEEMGILIQEVVGTKVGKYFFPSFAGVAFSRNEFRWSSRLNQEDGLIRMVPGLGTRAVDRLSNDYPILIAPGQPGLRVNVTLDEIIRYSPKSVDVMDLENGSFETIKIDDVLKEAGRDFPSLSMVLSLLTENHIQPTRKLGMDFEKDNFVVTFDGLIDQTDFVSRIHTILNVLEREYGYPVDIEFAHDGKDLYLLQCRSQSYREESNPATIPPNLSPGDVIFTGSKYISNGIIPNISHIVYVDPQKYSELSDYDVLKVVGKAVGRLNKILPKRQFLLMGPGRWGSRGDIKLGVSVSYSEINNTSMLIEIARKQKEYVPELSFGTHFFLDLVEANIRYLPLYPDDHDTVFDEEFLLGSENILVDLLPDMGHISDVIRVIDISNTTGGKLMHILMNADERKAIAHLAPPSENGESEGMGKMKVKDARRNDIHWRWRLRIAENIAARLDPSRFGVVGFYIFGSTKNATAGPGSDIDLLIHFRGSTDQEKDLRTWLEGWSQSLSQTNYFRTGYKLDCLLDVHLVTDEDIEKRTSYAVKIGAVTDAARPLPIGTEIRKKDCL
ncbi:MAG: PEP/pyruvate-binding domain-containing protein [Bacteroidota bacterium]|nr:PEP/pyruvate-binding domain-containing protein [Bacteroidota bacterium]